MSQFRNVLGSTSTQTVNRSYIPTDYNINQSEDYLDILAYNKYLNRYVGIKGETFDPTVPGFSDIYETNYDLIIGVTNGVVHAVSTRPEPAALYGGRAAAKCFYRLTVDTTSAGSFDISTLGHGGTVTYSAGESVDSIKTKVHAALGNLTNNSSTFEIAVTTDGLAVGIGTGNYQYNNVIISNVPGQTGSINTATADGSLGAVNIKDMSKYATNGAGVLEGTTYNIDNPLINSATHKDYSATLCKNISGIGVTQTNKTVCYGNTGKDYGYRTGINYATFREWSSTNGDSAFVSDGVNNSSASSASKIMKETTFDSSVTSSATGNAGLMYEYYNNLTNSNEEPYKSTREKYEKQYNASIGGDLYNAYIMAHMMNTDSTSDSGIVGYIKNNGRDISYKKGAVLTPDYNNIYRAAYPPEYAATHNYGITDDENSHFKVGMYYHPEPYDLGMYLRDDIRKKINNTRRDKLHPYVPEIAESEPNIASRGSCAEFNAYYTWFFNGALGCLVNNYRYHGIFRSRPVFAC